jgi:tetratricopeptide (TPR) repeat protein
LSGDEQQRLAKRPTENADAYQLYLKGRYYWNQRGPENIKKSIEYFNQAIGRDPNFALAYVGLADSYNPQIFGAATLSGTKDFSKSSAAASKALELDDTLAEAHASLGWLNAGQYDWSGAEKELKRAFELNPNYAHAHYAYAVNYLTSMGRIDEAIAELKKALELDPLNLVMHAHLGLTYYLARRFDDALKQLQKTIEMDPGVPIAHAHLAGLYEHLGKYEEAITEGGKARLLMGANSDKIAGGQAALRKAFAASGAAGYWRKLLELSNDATDPILLPVSNARAYAYLGDQEKALDAMEKAVEDRVTFAANFKVNPAFDGLRSHPRFIQLLRRLGLPP